MEKRKNDKWNNMTPREKKNAKIIIIIACAIILFMGISSLGDPSKSHINTNNEKKEGVIADNNNSDGLEDQDEDYITGLDPDEMEYHLKKEGYRIDNLKSDDILVSCQPNDSYGQNFTDRIMFYSDAIGKASAIRVESMSDGSNISNNEDAKQHYYWIGSFLSSSYHKNVNKWIMNNFNKKKSSIMLDKYTKIVMYALDKTTRRMDIFKVNDNNTTSPIPNDQLFEH